MSEQASGAEISEREIPHGQLNDYLLASIGLAGEPVSHEHMLEPLPEVCRQRFNRIVYQNPVYGERGHEMVDGYLRTAFGGVGDYEGLVRFIPWGRLDITDTGKEYLSSIIQRHESGEAPLEFLPEIIQYFEQRQPAQK